MAVARAVWTGSIGFGLVSIPVKLYPATAPRQVRFHQFARGTGQRVRHRRVVEGSVPEPESPWEVPQTEHEEGGPPEREGVGPNQEGAPGPSVPRPEPEIPFEDIVKGYEVSPGEFVMVEPEEIEELRPEPDHLIEIQGFVGLGEIDPVYFDRSYYVAPRSGGIRPYALLLRAMEEGERVGVARFVLRTREYLAAVRPVEGILGLETLFFSDEVRTVAEFMQSPIESRVSDRELKVARSLIDLLAMEWDPSRYADTYRDRLLALIESRAGARQVVSEGRMEERPGVPELLEALRASVEAAKAGTSTPRARSRRRTG